MNQYGGQIGDPLQKNNRDSLSDANTNGVWAPHETPGWHGWKREFLNFSCSFLDEDHQLCFLLDLLEVGDLKSSKHLE